MPTIFSYIASAPPESRARLRLMRSVVKKAAPKAKEDIRWKMPAIVDGRILVMYAGWKHHIGMYPTPSVLRAFKKELAGYKSAKGSVQFPHDKPLPVALIQKMVRLRAKENSLLDKKWKSREKC